MKFSLFLLFALLIPDSCFLKPAKANSEASLSQGDQTAQTLLRQMDRHKANAGAHPFYQGVPQESQYHETELKARAQAASVRDPGAQMVWESFEGGSQMKVDPQHDPLLRGSESVMENPLEVIGGKGTHVVEVQQGGGEQTIACEEPGENFLETCTRDLVVKVVKTKVRNEKIDTVRLTGCKKSHKKWHPKSCPALLSKILPWRPRRTLRTSNAVIDVTAAFKECLQEVMSKQSTRCYRCNNPRAFVPTDIKLDLIKSVVIEKNHLNQPLVQGTVDYSFHLRLKTYDLTATLKIIYEEDSYEILSEEWVSDCDRLEAHADSGLCGYHTKVCTQGPETRMIEGVPITKDCWQYIMTYSCARPSKDDCGPLRARGCAQINSACKQRVGNACVVYKQTYQCKDSPRTIFQIAGGDQVPFCMDGNCRDQSWDPNDEMMSSVAQLSILKEMQGNFEGGFLFKGEKRRCSKDIVNFKDCCGHAKGWGKDLGLSDCSPDEKLLNKDRKKGLCHRVGTYCTMKELGVCIEKKTSFCCFSSKLLKAFQEQGRAQIGMGWGKPKSPICRGFTIEEVQRIDFSKLDLREVFEELIKNYKPGKIQGQDKRLEGEMNFPNLPNQAVFDGARQRYAPPPKDHPLEGRNLGHNMEKKIGERLEVIKKGLAPK